MGRQQQRDPFRSKLDLSSVAYRPLDSRYLYNASALTAIFLRPELQAVWGVRKSAPSTPCHSRQAPARLSGLTACFPTITPLVAARRLRLPAARQSRRPWSVQRFAQPSRRARRQLRRSGERARRIRRDPRPAVGDSPTLCASPRIWRTCFRTCHSPAITRCFSKRRPWAAKSARSRHSPVRRAPSS